MYDSHQNDTAHLPTDQTTSSTCAAWRCARHRRKAVVRGISCGQTFTQFWALPQSWMAPAAVAAARLSSGTNSLSSRPSKTSQLAHLVPKLQLGNRHRMCRRGRVAWFPSWSLGTRETVIGQRLGPKSRDHAFWEDVVGARGSEKGNSNAPNPVFRCPPIAEPGESRFPFPPRG
jgi:hypothetical protein